MKIHEILIHKRNKGTSKGDDSNYWMTFLSFTLHRFEYSNSCKGFFLVSMQHNARNVSLLNKDGKIDHLISLIFLVDQIFPQSFYKNYKLPSFHLFSNVTHVK